MSNASPLNVQCTLTTATPHPLRMRPVSRFPSFVACQNYHRAHGARPMTWEPRPESKKSTSHVMVARW